MENKENIKGHIQWFPGHMAKTLKEMKKLSSSFDGILEILDCRAPLSSHNKDITEIAGNKPIIKVLNKRDLADTEKTKRFLSYFREHGIYAFSLDTKSGSGIDGFKKIVAQAFSEKLKKDEENGMNRGIKLMVTGIPNTGKSSFINKMSGAKKKKVENRAGVTRDISFADVGGGILLADTPGVLMPKIENKIDGFKLAFIGSVKDEVFDIETAAYEFIKFINCKYPNALSARYGVSKENADDPLDYFTEIAKKRGMMLRGGEPDYERVSKMLLTEFRKGLLGRIMLDDIND
ncbi:MAG: ribosome biogenesis GTPase YlqF [Candidatus Fimenecus sp.]